MVDTRAYVIDLRRNLIAGFAAPFAVRYMDNDWIPRNTSLWIAKTAPILVAHNWMARLGRTVKSGRNSQGIFVIAEVPDTTWLLKTLKRQAFFSVGSPATNIVRLKSDPHAIVGGRIDEISLGTSPMFAPLPYSPQRENEVIRHAKHLLSGR